VRKVGPHRWKIRGRRGKTGSETLEWVAGKPKELNPTHAEIGTEEGKKLVSLFANFTKKRGGLVIGPIREDINR